MSAKALNLVVRGQNRLSVMDAGNAYDIELIGAIGKSYWDDSGITEKEFRDALRNIPEGKSITLKVNSEGGSVQEGLGIYNAIKERRDDITARITGYALSIASVFPLGAGKVISPKSAIWMMHLAWSWAQGNAKDMEKASEMLAAHDETLIDIYAAETGKSKEEIRSAMEAETWVRGSNAVEWGLADETDDETNDAQAAYRPLAHAYLSKCKNISLEILNALRSPDPKGVNNTNATSQQECSPITGSGALSSAVGNGGQQKPNNQEEKMNKKTIVALLKKHGIEASETETEEQLQAKLEQIPTAGNSADVVALRNEIKRQRAEDRVNSYVDAQKITKDEAPIFVEAMLKDEAGTIKVLDAKPVADVGGEPISFNRIEGGNHPVLDGYQGRATEKVANMWKANSTPEARYNAMKAEYANMLKDAGARDKRGGVTVLNENSFAAGLTTNFLILGAITKLGPMVAPLNAFSRDNSVDPYKPLASGIQKFNSTVQDGSDTLTDATDFTGSTSSDSTLEAVTIAVHQYTQTLHLTNAQLNSGVRMADLIEAKLGSFRAKIAAVATAPITLANFGTLAGTTGAIDPVVSAPDAFGFSDLATLQGGLKKSVIKNVLLDGEYMARVSNTPSFFQQAGVVGGMKNAWSAFGWDLIALNTVWPAAENVRGFACNPQAIGLVSGLPLNPPEGIPGNVVQIGVAQLAGPDIAVATYLWFDANARTLRASYDIMLGASAVDKTAGIIIKSA